ncbi:MAG: dipeptide ABC transporter ATP-binding protein [Candidatus Promineifilaceae bacterium]
MSAPAVLDVQELTVAYRHGRARLPAVRDFSLAIRPGEVVGLVGESGSGKTTIALAVMGYLPAAAEVLAGRIYFQGRDLLKLERRALRRLWGRQMALVPQDPLASLNPAMPVGAQLAEGLRLHLGLSRRAAAGRAVELLEQAHVPDPVRVAAAYPHQISGGMQQRALIAMALSIEPPLLVLDEPTTALDVTTQAAILDLIEELIRSRETAALYVTHDMGVVASVCDRVAVLYNGELVEEASTRSLFRRPRHAYTQRLLASVPRPGDHKRSRPLGEHATAAPAAPARSPEGSAVLQLDGLKVHFGLRRSLAEALAGRPARKVRAVDGVSLEVGRGQTLGLVGESGSGKSSLARAVVGLEETTAGRVLLLGAELPSGLAKRKRERLRQLQIVFQNPDEVLNPYRSVGQSLRQPLRGLRRLARSAVGPEVERLLAQVRLPASYAGRRPGQLSGGEKQRVAIARALAARPALLVADEPVSSLDVSVQAAILSLLADLERDQGISHLFISHDLAVVGYLADVVAVMYAGQLMEVAPAEALFRPPYHPYTEALLSAVPVPDPEARPQPIRLAGDAPGQADEMSGCPFHPRCPRFLGEICVNERPPWRSANGRHIYCHIPLDELAELQAGAEAPQRPEAAK